MASPSLKAPGAPAQWPGPTPGGCSTTMAPPNSKGTLTRRRTLVEQEALAEVTGPSFNYVRVRTRLRQLGGQLTPLRLFRITLPSLLSPGRAFFDSPRQRRRLGRSSSAPCYGRPGCRDPVVRQARRRRHVPRRTSDRADADGLAAEHHKDSRRPDGLGNALPRS